MTHIYNHAEAQLLYRSKSGRATAEAEWDEGALLSSADSLRLHMQHTRFGAPGSLGESEGAQDRAAKGYCSLRQKLLQRDLGATQSFRPPSFGKIFWRRGRVES